MVSLSQACTLMDDVICRYGVPTQLHSDQGSNLNAEVNQKLCHAATWNSTHQDYSVPPTGKWASGTF